MEFIDGLFISCIIMFLWIVLGTQDWKNQNPVLSSAIGSLTVGITVLKLQSIGYLPGV